MNAERRMTWIQTQSSQEKSKDINKKVNIFNVHDYFSRMDHDFLIYFAFFCLETSPSLLLC